VKHQTVQNQGYFQLGLTVVVKEHVLRVDKKHLEKVGLVPIVNQMKLNFE